MAIGNVYMVKLLFRWNPTDVAGGTSEECSARWFYRHASGSAPLAGVPLANAFFSTVYDDIRALAPVEIELHSTEVINMYNPSDYNLFTGADVGLRTLAGGKTLSPVNNLGFYTDRPNPGVRRGRKRLPFLFTEEVNGKRIVMSAAAQTLAQNLAGAMGVNLSNSSQTFEPVIFAPAPGGYGSGGTVRFVIGAWNPDYTQIASQDSRKG